MAWTELRRSTNLTIEQDSAINQFSLEPRRRNSHLNTPILDSTGRAPRPPSNLFFNELRERRLSEHVQLADTNITPARQASMVSYNTPTRGNPSPDRRGCRKGIT